MPARALLKCRFTTGWLFHVAGKTKKEKERKKKKNHDSCPPRHYHEPSVLFIQKRTTTCTCFKKNKNKKRPKPVEHGAFLRWSDVIPRSSCTQKFSLVAGDREHNIHNWKHPVLPLNWPHITTAKGQKLNHKTRKRSVRRPLKRRCARGTTRGEVLLLYLHWSLLPWFSLSCEHKSTSMWFPAEQGGRKKTQVIYFLKLQRARVKVQECELDDLQGQWGAPTATACHQLPRTLNACRRGQAGASTPSFTHPPAPAPTRPSRLQQTPWEVPTWRVPVLSFQFDVFVAVRSRFLQSPAAAIRDTWYVLVTALLRRCPVLPVV